MCSFDVGIENLLDSASTTRVLSKMYFDSLNMIYCNLGISVLWQHVHNSNLSMSYSGLYNLWENHMLYCFHHQFYFLVHCLGYLGHDLH